MNMTDRINEFLKGSVGLIDDVDIAREMNATQVKYGKKLLPFREYAVAYFKQFISHHKSLQFVMDVLNIS